MKLKSLNPTLHPATYGDETTPVEHGTMITDEMVEKAYEAFSAVKPDLIDSLRAALEAVAPLLIADYQQSLNVLGDAYDAQADKFAAERPKLIAQGLREAAEIYRNQGENVDWDFFTAAEKAILDRAQELDPK